MVRLFFSRYRLIGAFMVAIIIYSFLYKSLRTNIKDSSEDRTNLDNHEITDKAFFEISVSGKIIGKLTIGLFANVVPKTVKNFIALSQGFQSVHNGEEIFISYKGSKFHRVIKNFMVQGGDIVKGNVSGSCSLYGGLFPDENFILKHVSEGWVSMANNGVNTNGCQFFITLGAAPWLDDHHVVFGKVVEGMDVVRAIGNVPTNSDDCPLEDVIISQCGIET